MARSCAISRELVNARPARVAQMCQLDGTRIHDQHQGHMREAPASALVRVSPEAYDLVIATYKTPIVALLEVGLVGAVLYHALNGIRVILIDFWSRGPRYQRAMTWVIAGIWLVVMIPGTYRMLTHTAEALFGSTP